MATIIRVLKYNNNIVMLNSLQNCTVEGSLPSRCFFSNLQNNFWHFQFYDPLFLLLNKIKFLTLPPIIKNLKKTTIHHTMQCCYSCHPSFQKLLINSNKVCKSEERRNNDTKKRCKSFRVTKLKRVLKCR